MRFVRSLVGITIVVLLTAVLAGPVEAREENTVASQTFRNPVNPSADPSLMFFNGRYYVATTRGDRIGIWSDRLVDGTRRVAGRPECFIDCDYRAAGNRSPTAISPQSTIRRALHGRD